MSLLQKRSQTLPDIKMLYVDLLSVWMPPEVEWLAYRRGCRLAKVGMANRLSYRHLKEGGIWTYFWGREVRVGNMTYRMEIIDE